MKYTTVIFLISMILFTLLESTKSSINKLIRGDQLYEIISQNSGKCLNVRGGHNSQIDQFTCNGKNKQKFKILWTQENTVFLMSARSGSVVQVAGASKGDRGNVNAWKLHGGKNQQFLLTQKGGWYTITNVWSGKVLYVSGSTKKNSANVAQNTNHGGATQLWELRPTQIKE